MLAVLLALAAVSLPVTHSLATQNFRVPAHDYRYIPAHVANWPATLICDAEVASGSAVTIELLTQTALAEFVRGRSPQPFVELDHRRKLNFRAALPEKGDYNILVINNNDQPSEIAFEASVEFAREPDVARYLSLPRRLAVISISLLVFVLSLSWSGFKLMAVMRR